MKASILRYAVLFGGVALLLAAQSSASLCYDTCTPQRCASECADHLGCAAINSDVHCAGRQAYCEISCEDGLGMALYCSDTCYTSGGSGGGGGSPVFARKPTTDPPTP